jgi:enoyl-CoA hydratase
MQFHPWLAGMRNAMELLLTGDSVPGTEAVRMGLANRAFPEADLEARTLDLAERVAKIPSDLQQLNKRSVHRAMEVKGARAPIRAGTDVQALAFHQPSARAYLKQLTQGVTKALDQRDSTFGDYRTKR